MMHEVVRDPARIARFEQQLGIPPGTVSEFELQFDPNSEPDGQYKPMMRVRIRASSIPDWHGQELATPTVALEVEAWSRGTGLLMAAASAMVNAALSRSLEAYGIGAKTAVHGITEADVAT